MPLPSCCGWAARLARETFLWEEGIHIHYDGKSMRPLSTGPGLAIIASAMTAAVAFWLSVLPASARSFQQPNPPGVPSARAEIVVVTGIIRPGDHHEFHHVLDRTNPDIVMMDGPGGSVEDALLMADEIHDRGLNTVVGPDRTCISACALLFLSGRARYVGERSGLGLHAPFEVGGKVSVRALGWMREHLAHFGVPADILAKMSSTPPSEVWWLGMQEHDALKIRFLEDTSESPPVPSAD